MWTAVLPLLILLAAPPTGKCQGSLTLHSRWVHSLYSRTSLWTKKTCGRLQPIPTTAITEDISGAIPLSSQRHSWSWPLFPTVVY